MTIEQVRMVRIKINELIQDVASDPQSANHAYNRCMEKILTHLEESTMWCDKTLNSLDAEEAENNTMSQ